MKKLLLLAVFFLLTPHAHAAIAADAHTTLHNISNSTTLTYSATVGSGTNRILFVSVLIEDSGAVSGVTYNGSSMTKIAEQPLGISDWSQSLFCLVAPSSGTNNVVVTNSSGSGNTIFSAASAYTGVNQSCTLDASNTFVGNLPGSSNIPFNLTTVTNNDWTILVASNVDNTWIAGTNSNALQAGSQQASMFDSNGPVTPAGSFTMNLSVSSGSRPYGAVMAAFAPAAAAPSVFPLFAQGFGWW